MNPRTVPAREPDPYEPLVGINATASISVSADTRWSARWIKAMRFAAYVIGPQRAVRLARWGAVRLVRVRFDEGRWHWLRWDEAEVSA